VPTQRINQNLFDDAVRAEVNYHRCRAGLRGVGEAGSGVVKVARGHSRWMASRQVLSHRSTVPGKASLSQRIKSSGVSFKTGSENIGMVHRYRIDNRRFRILDSASCRFSTYDGQPLRRIPTPRWRAMSFNSGWTAPGTARTSSTERRIGLLSRSPSTPRLNIAGATG